MDRIKSLYHGDPELPLQSVAEELSVCDWSVSMRVKKVLADVRLAVAEIEVNWNGTLRSSATLCAIVNNDKDGVEQVIPLNTPDGRPILLSWENALSLPRQP